MQTPSIQHSSSQNFDINTIAGLSEQEATARLAKEGYNELPSTGRRGIVKIAFEIVREPMFILLIAGGIIYLTPWRYTRSSHLAWLDLCNHGHHFLPGK